MTKSTLVLLAAISTFYVNPACADADMFRTIEQFEENTIDKNRYTRSPIRTYEAPPPVCAPGNSCAEAAKRYDEPVKHGEPVVSEDDY